MHRHDLLFDLRFPIRASEVVAKLWQPLYCASSDIICSVNVVIKQKLQKVQEREIERECWPVNNPANGRELLGEKAKLRHFNI